MSMNHGRFKVIKQEMARANVDILGISELKWTGMGEFNWNAKVGSQETPGVTSKFGLGVQNETGERLIEFCKDNVLVIPNTLFQQHKSSLYTWTSPEGQHQNQIDYIICFQRCRSSIQSTKTRLGADCGSDYELLVCKCRLKLKKGEKHKTIQV